MKCNACGFEMEENWRFCPSCGREMQPESEEARGEAPSAVAGDEVELELPKAAFEGPPDSMKVYADTVAVVISVAEYQSGLTVPHAERDTAGWLELLDHLGVPQQNQLVLRNEEATMTAVVRLFSKTLPTRVKPGSRLLLFYSGNVLDLPRVNAPMQPWFIPYDARSQDTWGTCLSGRRIFDWLKSCGVHHSLLVIDAASSGFPDLGAGAELGMEEETPSDWGAAARQEVCQVLTAARSEQEIVRHGPRSVFLELLATGLTGEADRNEDGVVTGQELGDYIAHRLLMMSGGDQIATHTRMWGSGDVLLVPYCEGAVAGRLAEAPVQEHAVRLTSEPSGATVYINDENRGSTPLELDLTPGRYEVRVAAPGYRVFHGRLRYNGVKAFSQHIELKKESGVPLPDGLRALSGEVDPGTQYPLRVIRLKDEAEMVLVPEGPFMMGLQKGREEERPPHMVRLAAYYIDRYPVTNKQYQLFLKESGPRQPKFWSEPRYNVPNQPVVGIGWNEARRYCEWAGAALPTEAEWEKAARATDGRLFPWGNMRPTPAIACYEKARKGPGPVVVDRLPRNASPYGAEQMSGNVWEWCADWYEAGYYGLSPPEDPPGAEAGTEKIIRGGAWNTRPLAIRVTARGHTTPDYRGPDVGFRCLVRCKPLEDDLETLL